MKFGFKCLPTFTSIHTTHVLLFMYLMEEKTDAIWLYSTILSSLGIIFKHFFSQVKHVGKNNASQE